MTTGAIRLDRKQMTTAAGVLFAISASCPLVVQNGSIPATYFSTQVIGVPLGFLIVGAVVALLSVGYTAMSRKVPHAAVYYAVNARGLGRPVGVACGAIALLAYNTIQISLYGFLGFTLHDMFGIPWWLGALLVVALVGLLGVRRVVLSTGVLAVVLALSLMMVVLFVLAALNHPVSGHLSASGFHSDSLFVTGVGGAAAYCLAALMGFEIPCSFSEEARTRTAPGRAVLISLTILIGLYTIVAWAMGVGADPADLADPAAGLPYPIYDRAYSALMPPVVRLALVAAVITSMLALHSIAARYGFAMAREGILPRRIAWTGRDPLSNTPVGGSLLQTLTAALVVAGFAISGADPLATLFAWLSAIGAIGLLALLVVTSMAAIAYLRSQGPRAETLWRRLFAPALGVIGGMIVLVTMVANVGSLLGVGPGSAALIIVPAVPLVVGILGLLWAAVLAAARPAAYQAIGRGHAGRRAVIPTQLVDIDI